MDHHKIPLSPPSPTPTGIKRPKGDFISPPFGKERLEGIL